MNAQDVPSQLERARFEFGQGTTRIAVESVEGIHFWVPSLLVLAAGQASAGLGAETNKHLSKSSDALALSYFKYLYGFLDWIITSRKRTRSCLPLFVTEEKFAKFERLATSAWMKRSLSETWGCCRLFFNDPSNTSEATGKFGAFYSTGCRSESELRSAYKHYLLESGRWGEERWSQESFDKTLDLHVFSRTLAPRSFYKEEHPVVRNLWSSLFVCELFMENGVLKRPPAAAIRNIELELMLTTRALSMCVDVQEPD